MDQMNSLYTMVILVFADWDFGILATGGQLN